MIDSQSVKSAEKGGPAADRAGYDAGKKVKGIKRHLCVDTEGLILAAYPTNWGARGWRVPCCWGGRMSRMRARWINAAALVRVYSVLGEAALPGQPGEGAFDDPTLAAEKLREVHGITLGRETLRLWMIEAGAVARSQAAAEACPSVPLPARLR